MKGNLKWLVLSITILLTMCFSSIASAALPYYGEENVNQPSKSYEQKFEDVKKNHWAFMYIMEMTERGVLSGYPNGKFYPENTITRAEFAKIMCLAAELKVSSVNKTSYSDVKASAWYAPYVEAGKYYLSGYISTGKKYYRPDSNALREDIAVALVKLKGYDTSVYDESILKTMFTDWQSISEDARKYVSVAVEKELISGYEDDTFRGQSTLTRAEAATLLWRAYQYGSGNKVFEKEELDAPETNNEQPEYEENEQEEELSLSLKVSDTSFEVVEGEYVDFKITVSSNIEGKYVPQISGDTNILSGSPNISTTGSKTICKYKTEELEVGEYELKLSIEDDFEIHEKTIKITVKEPEPEYTYEMDTVENNVSSVRQMVATKHGFVYWKGNDSRNKSGNFDDTVYEYDGFSSSVIFTTENFGYLGEEDLSKEKLAKVDTDIYGIGYNQNDECVYAFIRQNSEYYIYNITDECVERKLEIYQTNSEGYTVIAPSGGIGWYEITFDNDNNLYLDKELIMSDRIPAVGFRGHSITFLLKDTVCCTEGGYDLNHYNTRTGDWEEIDYYIEKQSTLVCANNKYAFFVAKGYNELYSVDLNGNSELVYTINDIDNVDRKVIKLDNIQLEKSAASKDGTIYFYDDDYDCIRLIRKK